MPLEFASRKLSPRHMTEKIDKTSQKAKSPRWIDFGEVALIVAICVLLAGDPAPAVNEPHYLCRAKHLWDSSYCAGDLFLESPDAHVAFVYSVGWLTEWLSLAAVAWIGRLVCWSLLAVAWLWLVRAVVPKVGFAALAAAVWLVLVSDCHLAGEWIVGGFEAKCIAYPCVIWGLGFALRDRWNEAWICLGAATAFHALVGAWSIVALVVVWLVSCPNSSGFMKMVPGLLVGGLLGLVGVIPALALSHGVSAEVNAAAAEIYVYDRLAHHLAPLSKPPDWIAVRFGRNLIALGLFFAISVSLTASTNSLAKKRLSRLLLFAAASLLIALVGITIELAGGENHTAVASLLRYYWLRLADIAVPMGVSVAIAWWLSWLFEARRNGAAALLALLLVTVGWPLWVRVSQRVEQPIPTAVKVTDFAAWREACDWISNNTPADALFLTPRGNSTFKWYASRAEVVTHKDVPQDATTLLEWHKRINEVYRPSGLDDLTFYRSTGELGTPRIEELAAEFGFDYVLTTGDFPLDLPVVFANATYVVYQVNEE